MNAASNPLHGRPTVSVIVPVRNEEASLGSCLESLVGQPGVDFELIVVDDSSSDRTREIAQSFPPVTVVEAGVLPQGWAGKNNALAVGARAAHGEWLLFTDADTIHLPGSLARSFAEAKRHDAALLSYSPAQDVHGFGQKAVMPVIFAELASTYSPSRVSDPRSSAAAANGQYILMSRKAYDAIGGHAAVGSSLLEDVALARLVKQSGRKVFFRYGPDAVRTRMYRSFTQLREGWSKNLALLFPTPARLAFLRLAEFALIVGSAALAMAYAVNGRRVASLAMVMPVIILYGLFLNRIRKAHFSWDADIVALLGLPIFSYLLLRSRALYRKGAVTWKGRTYPGNLAVDDAHHPSAPSMATDRPAPPVPQRERYSH